MPIKPEMFFCGPAADGRDDDGHSEGFVFEACHRAALLITRDHHLAEDAVQRACLKILKLPGDGLARIPTERRQAYLLTAVRNEARRLVWSHRQEIPFHDEHIRSLPCAAAPPDVGFARSRLQQVVHDMINALPERCREVMSLYVYNKLTRREVSNSLGISLKAVEKQITRGYRLLREMPEAQQLPEWHGGGG
jgi:RNA polymerase sigma factor (sigma-70 family)